MESLYRVDHIRGQIDQEQILATWDVSATSPEEALRIAKSPANWPIEVLSEGRTACAMNPQYTPPRGGEGYIAGPLVRHQCPHCGEEFLEPA
jgi:hypothetical protein